MYYILYTVYSSVQYQIFKNHMRILLQATKVLLYLIICSSKTFVFSLSRAATLRKHRDVCSEQAYLNMLQTMTHVLRQ
jgi:ACR3 family arsenite efflux pump ArsB